MHRLRQWFQPAPGLSPQRARALDDAAGIELEFATPMGDIGLRLTYRDCVPGRSLVFDLHRQDPRGSHDSRVTLTFEQGDGETWLSLHHEGLENGLPPEQIAEIEAGWRHTLGRLIGACPRAVAAYYSRLESAPGFHSKFGGLWPDALDAEARLAQKRTAGALDERDQALFEHWREKGYVALEGAVSTESIDAFCRDLARDWEHGNPDVTIELCDGEGGFHKMQPAMHDRPHKVVDYHAVSKNARDIQFAPAILRFLEQLFERSPMACQSLLFRYGTEQAMHQDTAYVVMRSPMQLVGCWVALEDVVEGSGELQYYEGSHRIPEYLWFDQARARPPGYEDDAEFLAWVAEKSVQAGCNQVRFLPKKGDALIWHADLVHGGSPRTNRELTRRSFVSHYCPADVDPAWMRPGQCRYEHVPGAYYCFDSI